jgi:predicted ABC-type ATPase
VSTLPEMYVFAGCNGAGKSTLIDHFGGGFEKIINPDQIA